jgi:HD-GYP domain-containing protein (c-di-GMP phosphodiesterase class II)
MGRKWSWAGQYGIAILVAVLLGVSLSKVPLFNQTTLVGNKLTAAQVVEFLGYGGALLLFWLLGRRTGLQLQRDGKELSFLRHIITPLTTLIAVPAVYKVLLPIAGPFLDKTGRIVYNWAFVGGMVGAGLWLIFAGVLRSAALVESFDLLGPRGFSALFLLLCATALINFYVPQKLAALDFYFLPMLVGGYYLGRQKFVPGTLLCVCAVPLYIFFTAESLRIPSSLLDEFLRITIWGGVLIVAGAVAGRLQKRLNEEITAVQNVSRDLKRQEEEIKQGTSTLKLYTNDLESRVKLQGEELRESKLYVETLKAKMDEALSPAMDPSVVKLMMEGRLRNDKRNVSVLFSDLVGFTTYSEEHPPESVIQELNRFLGDMEPVLLMYRGHIDKYMGDGIMCEFGAPLDVESYRLLAVLAGLKMQEKRAALSYPWQMRVGIASGSTITGLIGSKRQNYTAIGDVVNVAARLEKSCPPGRILIDRFTYDGVQPFVEARKVRDQPNRDVTDIERERRLESLHEQLAASPDKAQIHYEIGRIHLELDEVPEAFSYFERALHLEPGHVDVKVAYAEAGMRLKEAGKISVKGKRTRIEAYELIALKDPLKNRDKIPDGVAEKYRHAVDGMPISEDVILPVEGLDGSVGHAKVVALLSYAVASVLGMSETDKHDLLIASYMADAGKHVIPHHLLNRKGGLTASEFEIVRRHPIESTKLMDTLGHGGEGMVRIVRHSHECYDGSGYPDGLAGEKIPQGSRIVAVADAYDALTSWRAYRDPWERHAALNEIRRGVTKGLYDPKVVEVFRDIMGSSRP